MTGSLLNFAIILALLGVNGLFAMTEIALVSSRKARLRRLAVEGDARAALALELAESPNRFLSTVQIGITLVGILAGAFGGATIAQGIAAALEPLPLLAPYGEAIGIAAVVVTITYLSLVIGELVPKRIALGNPERIAMATARPMHRFSRIASPVVHLLSFSTETLLRLLGVKATREAALTEEEIKLLVREELRADVFQKVESEMVDSVLMLDTLPVREFMTPRPKITWLNKDDQPEIVRHKLVGSHHTHFPVYDGNRDNVAGIVSIKAMYADTNAPTRSPIAGLMTQPLVVPATQTAMQLLETFKQTGKHIALVADEFGGIVGLVTLHDVMEAILGDFPSWEERLKPGAKKRDDGSWLIDGLIEIERVAEILPGAKFADSTRKDYQTLAGFVVTHLGRVPKEGETFESEGYVFEVLDMDRHRVDKILVTRAPTRGEKL